MLFFDRLLILFCIIKFSITFQPPYLGYEVEEKEARRTLIRQLLPKKSKVKENNDVDDEDDVVPLPISTTYSHMQHSL